MPQLHREPVFGAHAHGHADVGLAFAHAPHHLRLVAHVQREADAGGTGLELRHHGRQELVGEALRADQLDLAHPQAPQGQDVLADALDVQPGTACMRGQQLTRGVQTHAARLALEQQGVEFALQARDLPAHGRGCHVQARGRFGDRAGVDHLHEVAQRHLLQHALVHRLGRGAVRARCAGGRSSGGRHAARLVEGCL
jgi:hypothetical protein